MLVLRSAKLRSLGIGVGAFLLGSATIGAAAATVPAVGTIFYTTLLNSQPTTPCKTVTTSAGSTTTCNAIVDADGNLHVLSQGTATVAVTNTPTVRLDPSGGTVQLANGATVGIASSEANPVFVANVGAGQNVYASGGSCFFATGPGGTCNAGLRAGIDPGKRLVIETVTMSVRVPTGTPVLALAVEAFGTTLDFIPTKVGSDGATDTYAVSQSVRAYFTNTGTSAVAPFCRINLGSLSGEGFFGCTVEGYIVTPS